MTSFWPPKSLSNGRHQHYSDEQMLSELRQLFSTCGQISGILIDEASGLPSSAAYRHRFGSLSRAYQLVGYHPSRDYSFMETQQKSSSISLGSMYLHRQSLRTDRGQRPARPQNRPADHQRRIHDLCYSGAMSINPVRTTSMASQA